MFFSCSYLSKYYIIQFRGMTAPYKINCHPLTKGSKMAYVYYNPNPYQRRGIGDCTIRCLAKALNTSWDSAYIELASQGFFLKDMPSSNIVLNSYLHSKGFRRYAISNLCPDCYTFRDFAKDHPKGTFIVGTGTHVACIKDSNLYDSWNSTDETPIFYWKREEKE